MYKHRSSVSCAAKMVIQVADVRIGLSLHQALCSCVVMHDHRNDLHTVKAPKRKR